VCASRRRCCDSGDAPWRCDRVSDPRRQYGRGRSPLDADRARTVAPTLRAAVAAALRSPVSRVDLRLADRLARRFLVSYLQFAYGRASGESVKGFTPGLRSQLIAHRVQSTPAERGRHLRAVSLATVGTTPGFVVVTATIKDGAIAAYRLRFMLQEQADRWLVSSVQEG
jgi:hypothetical protein